MILYYNANRANTVDKQLRGESRISSYVKSICEKENKYYKMKE